MKIRYQLPYLEFHTSQLVHDLAHGLPDDVPGDLVVGLSGGLHRVTSQVIESHNVLQHAHCLVEGAVSVVRTVAVLLQKIIL